MNTFFHIFIKISTGKRCGRIRIMHTCGISLLPTCIKRLPIGLASQVFRMTLLNLSPLLAYIYKATAHRLRKSGLSNDVAQPMGSRLCV